jgi:hypothetical protein
MASRMGTQIAGIIITAAITLGGVGAVVAATSASAAPAGAVALTMSPDGDATPWG